MILSANTLRRRRPVHPFCERTLHRGLSYGVSLAGYDVRARIEDRHYPSAMATFSPEYGRGIVVPPGATVLVCTVEVFTMPTDVVGIAHNKSTWARQGLMVPSVVLEPGWCGFLTVALSNLGTESVSVFNGDPIAQIVFHELDSSNGPGYTGKYQDQGPEPTPARAE